MISTRLQLFSLVLCSALACLAPAVRGQPAVFFDVGSINPPSTPPSAQLYVSTPELFDFGIGGEPGEVLTVKWLKFKVATPIEGELYMDIDSRITTADTVPGDLFMALYDGAGNLVATDDTDGSFPEGLAAGLSFGSTAIRLQSDRYLLAGQDGNLGVGEYWLALLAGSASQVTASPTGWNASTTREYQLGFFTEGTYYIDFSISIGNTTPLPPPSNDDCSNALTIGENSPSGEPVWSGTNAGATSDVLFPCENPEVPAAFRPKTIWFNYIPTQTGFAEVVATGVSGVGVPPVMALYPPDGCGSFPSQCEQSFHDSQAGTMYVRFSFPTVQGEPVLLALAADAGSVGPMTLDVRLLPPPCPLTIPAGAVAESEAACGDTHIAGCSVFPWGAFEAIALGQTVHGTLYNDTGYRDVDWFEFTIPTHSNVTVSYQAQYPSFLEIHGTSTTPDRCADSQTLIWLRNLGFWDICRTTTGSVELQPGTYRMYIANWHFDGIGCGAGYEQYWLSLSAQAVPPEPPVLVPCGRSDIAGPGQSVGFDGELTADDI
ncbi:MAG: hypothetical protein ACK5TP_05260, partial [bacterium]